MKLLFVDDEPDVVQLYSMSFRKEVKSGEYELLFASSASEALDVMGNLQPMDVVLLMSDINMPGQTGFDLLQLAKGKYPWVKICMVSAYGDKENYEKAKQLGADGFITKPVDFVVMKTKIQELSGAA